MSAPAQTPAPSDDAQRRFLNRAVGFTFWENTFKLVAPMMELLCAALFVGGTWGRYKFFESLVFVVFRISLMGMDKGVIWYYSQAGEDAYLRTLFRGLGWCLMAWLGLSLLAMGGHYGLLPTGFLIGSDLASFKVSGAEMLMYLSAVPFMLTSELCIQANVNKRNLKYRILVPGITVPLTAYGIAAISYFTAPGAVPLAACLLIGHATGAAVAVTGFLRAHRPAWRHVSVTPLPPWAMLRYSFPLAGANIFAALAVRVDIFMLAGLAGVKGVEVYAVVSMVGKSLISIRQSFENILLSTFSSAGEGRLTARARHYFNYAVWLVMGIQGALLFVAAMFGAELLGLVNPQYAAGYWTLVITASFIYLNTSTDFLALLTLGMGRSYVVPVVNVLFFAANILLNAWWIPLWDSAGAALALGVSNTFAGLLYLAFIRRTDRSWPFVAGYWKHLLAGALILAAPLSLVAEFDPGLPVKAAFAILALTAYGGWQWRSYRRLNARLTRAGAA